MQAARVGEAVPTPALFVAPGQSVKTAMKDETIARVVSLLCKTPVKAQDPVVCTWMLRATSGREKVLFI